MEPANIEIDKIQQILKDNPQGLSVTDISFKLNLNRNSVAKYLEMMTISGNAVMRKVGPAKVYIPNDRVPITSIMNFSRDFILVLNKNYHVVDCNTCFLDYLEHTKEDIVGKTLYELSYLPIIKALLQNTESIEKALEGIDDKNEIEVLDNADKKFFSAKFIPTSNDTIFSTVTIFLEDFTEAKLARENIKKSEAKYRTIFENSGTAMFIDDIDMNIILANSKFQEMMEYSQEDLLKIKSYEFLSEKDKNMIVLDHHLRRKNRENVPSHYELNFKNKSGKTLNTLATIEMMPGSLNTVVSLIDITDLKESQKKLHKIEEKFSLIFKTVPIILVISKMKDGSILDVNEQFCKVTGFDRNQVIGKTTRSINLWQDFKDRDEVIKKLREGKTIENKMFRYYGVDGRKINALFSSRPIEINHQKCMISAVIDITELGMSLLNASKKRNL